MPEAPKSAAKTKDKYWRVNVDGKDQYIVAAPDRESVMKAAIGRKISIETISMNESLELAVKERLMVHPVDRVPPLVPLPPNSPVQNGARLPDAEGSALDPACG